MSKSHKKQGSKGQRVSALPPTTTLRPRLDALFGNPALPEQVDDSLRAELDTLAQGVKADFLLPTMLRAYLVAPATAQERLNQILPDWLRKRGYTTTLEQMMTNQALDPELQAQALSWLGAAGSDTEALTTQQHDLFYDAYYHGNEMQAALIAFWYTDQRRNRVRGLSFLIDFQPPWDGSVKDIIFTPQRAPEVAVRYFVDVWRAQGMDMQPIGAVEAKQKMLEALFANRKASIRLPRDLIACRDYFIGHVLSLPDGPNTPAFTAEDFDLLSKNGQSAEELGRKEQLFGYRTRTPDGKEILIMRDPELDDF